MVKIVPTLACASYLKLKDQIDTMDRLGVSSYHIDIMDGNYVQNYCLNWDYIAELKAYTKTPIDVHLMVTNVERDVLKAIELKVDNVAIHAEVGCKVDLKVQFSLLKQAGIKCGLVLNPETTVSSISSYLDFLDYILLMGVKPGFAGQKFKEETLEKIKEAKALVNGREIEIWVDGGIDFENAKLCKAMGADALIAGALCIFKKNESLTLNLEKFYNVLKS